MGKIQMHIDKMKSVNSMKGAWEHNMRIDKCENVDHSLSSQNVSLIDRGMSYGDYYKKLIKEDYKPRRYNGTGAKVKIRTDAVKMFDILISVNANEAESNPFFDLDEFLKRSKEFAVEEFGEKNIAGMVYHADEGAPHIHIQVVPITPDGKLNSHYFVDRDKLTDMQSRLADRMTDLGLERGRKKSVVDRRTIREYYGAIKESQTSTLPDPEPGEDIMNFKYRCDAKVKVMQSQKMAEIEKKDAEIRALRTEIRQLSPERIEELETENKALKKKNEDLSEDVTEYKKALADWRDLVCAVQNKLMPDDEIEAMGEYIKDAVRLGKDYRTQREIEEKR